MPLRRERLYRPPTLARLKALAVDDRFGAYCVLTNLVVQVVAWFLVRHTTLSVLEAYLLMNMVASALNGYAILRLRTQLDIARGAIPRGNGSASIFTVMPILSLWFLIRLVAESRAFLRDHRIEVGLLGASKTQFILRAESNREG
ncbi:MAG: hypothetical protein ACFBZ8_11640 [Opitutales bacterium]